MKSFKILYLLPLLLFSFCKNADKKDKANAGASDNTTEQIGQQFTIKGKLNNYKVNQLLLQELSLGQSQVVLDTANVDAEGNFVFEGFVREKTFAVINLGQNRSVFFVIDTTSNIEVEIDGGAMLQYEISNSPESAEVSQIANLIAKFNDKRNDLMTDAQANPTMSTKERDELQVKMQAIVESFKGQAQEAVKGFKNPISQVFAIEYFQIPVDAEQEEIILESIAKEPNNRWFAQYRSKAEGRVSTKAGKQAPDFTLPTPEGNELSLSSLKGKYVLLDFWASWCGPCRQENPNVVRVYNKYKNKGFEILGVSLDKEKGAWVQAIAKDGLPWKHVSDLKFWQSEAAQLYSVQAIPQTFLLDKNGVIIAKGLRGASLENKLAEIFN